MDSHSLFNAHTEAVVFGMQIRAVQGMLDFDYMARRKKPSVACMVFSFSGNHYKKFYWGTEEILLPVYQKLSYALKRHPAVDCIGHATANIPDITSPDGSAATIRNTVRNE